jgi:hypothetical protein
MVGDMKKTFFILILICGIAFAQSLSVENIIYPQTVNEGDTFDVSADIRNFGSEPAGTSTDPLIARLFSESNCIINSAKIIWTLQPGESKNVRWVVTAPSYGICTLTVAAENFTKTYASESVIVNIVTKQGSTPGISEDGTGGGTGTSSATFPGMPTEDTEITEPGSTEDYRILEELGNMTDNKTYDVFDITEEEFMPESDTKDENILILAFLLISVVAVISYKFVLKR